MIIFFLTFCLSPFLVISVCTSSYSKPSAFFQKCVFNLYVDGCAAFFKGFRKFGVALHILVKRILRNPQALTNGLICKPSASISLNQQRKIFVILPSCSSVALLFNVYAFRLPLSCINLFFGFPAISITFSVYFT